MIRLLSEALCKWGVIAPSATGLLLGARIGGRSSLVVANRLFVFCFTSGLRPLAPRLVRTEMPLELYFLNKHRAVPIGQTFLSTCIQPPPPLGVCGGDVQRTALEWVRTRVAVKPVGLRVDKTRPLALRYSSENSQLRYCTGNQICRRWVPKKFRPKFCATTRVDCAVV